MIYLLLILAFSLFFFLQVRFSIVLIKKIQDEYIKFEMDSYMSKVFLEIPEMKLTVKSFVPILSFEYKVGSKSTAKAKSGKIIISPLRDIFRKIIDSMKFFVTYFYTFKILIIRLLKKVNLVYLNINIAFGSENPAFTGVLAGTVWTIISQSLGLLSVWLNFEGAKVKVVVTPDFFKHKSFQMKIDCIFSLRVGYIIIASFIVAWYLMIYKIRSLTKKHQHS